LLQHLATHLHTFAKETGLTHAEWRKAIELLTKAGEITDDERNEFVLFSDVLGVSSLVDMINSKPDSTSSSVLGPFHILGAPDLPYGGDLKRDNDGATVIVKGYVRDPSGNPIEGAAIELWQTAENGLYSNQDPNQDRYNLRSRMISGKQGEYGFSTIRPAPYTVPDDGPVGELLHATGRHPWRPSHLHFIITAPGYHSLVTEVFPSDDPYLDEDAVFGVRDDLVMEYVEQTDPDLVPDAFEAKEKLTSPFFVVDFDFVLSAEEDEGSPVPLAALEHGEAGPGDR
ncbi:MAG: dioxygenase, partial [Pseudomonadota bacterium]